MIQHPIPRRYQFTVKYHFTPKCINFLLIHFQEQTVPENPLVKKRPSSYSQAISISRKLVKTINTFRFDRQLTDIQALRKLLVNFIELGFKSSCLTRDVKTKYCK